MKHTPISSKKLNSCNVCQTINAMRVFEYLEANPIIEIQKTARELDIAFNTISSIVKDLIGIGVLEQTSTQSRNRTFVYKEYLEILKEGT